MTGDGGVGHERDLAEGAGERGRVGGQSQIAGERQAQAGARARPLTAAITGSGMSAIVLAIGL